MTEINLAAMRVWATQQHNLLGQLVEVLNSLAELKGDSRFPLQIPSGHRAMKRRRRRPPTQRESVVDQVKALRQRKGRRKGPGIPVGERTSDYITKVLTEARKPLDIATLTDGVLANGWKTTSATPKTIVLQTLYDMREKTKKVKMYGKKGHRQWGFTNWKAAVKAAKAFEAAQANGSSTE